LSTTGSISFGIALVAGRNRVPKPPTGKIALRNGFRIDSPRTEICIAHDAEIAATIDHGTAKVS
jgi:hypothetical protein